MDGGTGDHRCCIGMALVYGYVPSDWSRDVLLGRLVNEDRVDLRGEEFNALIHGLEIQSKKNWYRR